ncbi:MAG: hypothetical protein AAF714_08780 [Pseudomonadota bacterium]
MPEQMSTILCVGDLDTWKDVLRDAETGGAPLFVSFSEVTVDLLDRVRPSTIMSPLLAHDFDSTDLAERLQDFGFGGRYVAVAVGVPLPQIIEREVRMAAPLVDFDLITLRDVSKLN